MNEAQFTETTRLWNLMGDAQENAEAARLDAAECSEQAQEWAAAKLRALWCGMYRIAAIAGDREASWDRRAWEARRRAERYESMADVIRRAL